MTTKEIKKWLRGLGVHRTLRVTSTGTKHPYFTAWIPYERVEGNKLVYPKDGFPLALRQSALHVIYGGKIESATGSAGNIGEYSMAMHSHEWQQTKEMRESIDRAQKAINGDSNDEEHDALVDLLEALGAETGGGE